MKLWTRIVKDEKGQDLVEYGLLIVLIGLVAMAAMRYLTTGVNTLFSNAHDQLVS
jgi:Flp pilus assembly pilin Flp